MKKSKFLQNSKDLVSRSFNPSKCKTSLRLAGSRLKLLRNKKEVQVKQAKREIAQLLESGQDQTARIRVEHVVREEKMMDAYDLLQIYCELVVVRLPIIESQKTCPIDLKEAIASLVFAAPRCGDVPELLDVRKQITAKYGKDFTTAAIELRPQCGVGRMLVEKLSATAPDGQTKLKIFTAIAEGHNIKWDPKSFGDKDYVPENDMGGSSSFTKESELSAKPPHIEVAQVQSHPNSSTMNTSPSNFSQQEGTTSVGPEKLIFAQNPGLGTTFQSEARPTALRNERRQEDRYTSSSIDTPLDRSRWNMEFKDAASAAQAAAESAERANMAARAAAEFSGYGRISRQYSTEHSSHGRISSQYSTDESHESNADILKDEGPQAHPNSKSLSERTRLKNGKMDGIKLNPKMAKTVEEDGAGSSQGYYSQSASLKSEVLVSDEDNMSDHGTTGVDEYTARKNSLKDVSKYKTRAEEQAFRYETESADNRLLEKVENVKKGRVRRDHSNKSYRSQSSTSDDVNIFSNSEYQKIEKDAAEDPFVGVNGRAPQTSYRASAALFIDKSDSDINDDHILFDKGPTYDDQEFHLSSSFDKRSLEKHTDSWSPRSSSSSNRVNSTSSLFFTREKSSPPDHSENTTLRDDSEHNSAPLMYDDSDGPISESDNEDMNTRHTKVDDSKDSLHNEKLVFDSQNLPFSSDDEFGSSLEIPSERNQVNIYDDESSPDDTGGRLNFGKLTGGFRHKGHNQLPFLKNRLDASSSSSVKKESEETTAAINTSTNIDERLERNTIMPHHKKIPRTQEGMNSESDSDSSVEAVSLPKNSGSKTPVKEVKTKPDSFFDTDNSDLDVDSSKEGPLSRKYHMQRSGISRRTKASPASKAASHTKAHLRTEEAFDDSDAGDIARKPTTSNSMTRKKAESHRKNSGKWETYEEPTSMPSKSSFWVPPEKPVPANTTSVTKDKPKARDSDASLGKKPSVSHARQELESRRNFSRLGDSEKPNSVKSTSKLTDSTLSRKETSTTTQESKISSEKSSAVEEPKAKTSIGSVTTSNKDESAKKEPSHVHPKLPDYDTLFQSLRVNRN